MDNMKAEQVMSGTQGELWIDGQYMAEVTAFKAEIKLVKEEVNQVKKVFKQYKITGAEATGNVKLNHVSSFFAVKMADNIKNGKQTVCTIVSKVDDPDAIGAERVVIRDATFDKLTLADWQAKKLVEDDYDFTFTDFELLDVAE
ncbi:phage tail tube protein [Megasphaera massiliensis]|uniref:phage tail tube protein n=1 Tax=Megasphaera massiliensis TaxID=1232428 RepID=UPI0004026E89|nr:phage tail tube protein [Megasphaera massiliensis]DAF84472.1 MAG TPA: tail tube protein [Caudoviricetes sp.]